MSPGAIGTAVAQQRLRGVLCYCNSPLLNQVETYIPFKPGLITADGEVSDAVTEEFLRNYMTELRASSRASSRYCRATPDRQTN
jgi:chromate reductase